MRTVCPYGAIDTGDTRPAGPLIKTVADVNPALPGLRYVPRRRVHPKRGTDGLTDEQIFAEVNAILACGRCKYMETNTPQPAVHSNPEWSFRRNWCTYTGADLAAPAG